MIIILIQAGLNYGMHHVTQKKGKMIPQYHNSSRVNLLWQVQENTKTLACLTFFFQFDSNQIINNDLSVYSM